MKPVVFFFPSNTYRPIVIEGSLEVKLPTVWADGKAEVGRVREEKRREEKSRHETRRDEKRREEKRKSQKKEDAGARKGTKVAIHLVFRMISGSGGSKSTLAKAAGAEPSGQMIDERLHAVVARSTFGSQNVQSTPGCAPLWCEAHFEVKMCKAHQVRSTFGS